MRNTRTSILILLIVLMGPGQNMSYAVVPPMAEIKSEDQTIQQRIEQIISKIEDFEKLDTSCKKFLSEIKMELIEIQEGAGK
ncbi:MAG: hypothetical protein KBD53_09805 [Candidatus Omnitrophica bacterium]|nr:hypothetical protein [Candidatus Omnitrophota bacterium]